MDNHKVTYSALQKFYSALKSLDSFSSTNNFFDAIAYLDTFFAEFRNITFVIQKELDSDSRVTYEELRDKHMKNEDMKWFIDTRNAVTKQSPFNLKKTLTIDVYLPKETISFKDSSSTVKIYESFDRVISSLKDRLMQEFEMVELFLSSKIIFSEDGNEVDIYPKIVEGIRTMNSFLTNFLDQCPCNCDICRELHKYNDNLYSTIIHNELIFVKDYVIEQDMHEGIVAEIKIVDDDRKIKEIGSARVSMDAKIFKEYMDDDKYLFDYFINTHIKIYIMQEYKIIPVFMIIYNDRTLRVVPMIAEVKSTFYRKVKAISELVDFQEIKAIFYCGESYVYRPEMFHDLNQLPYSQRIKKAQSEVLTFTMVSIEGTEKTMHFEKVKINDKLYIDDIRKKSQSTQFTTISEVDWLNPIRRKFFQFKK